MRTHVPVEPTTTQHVAPVPTHTDAAPTPQVGRAADVVQALCHAPRLADIPERAPDEPPEEARGPGLRHAASPGAAPEAPAAPVQRRALRAATDDPLAIHAAAVRGTIGGGGALPHLARIQSAFGGHDVSMVQAHTDARAAAAARAMGAEAFATGLHVAFASPAPSLHTAAHEAAHVVQQRAGVHLQGGVGAAGDPHERHADAVADAVVEGRSAEALLDRYAPPGDVPALQAKRVAIPSGTPIVQRALALAVATGKPKADLTGKIGTHDVTRFDHGETMTEEWGDESSTANFTNANGSGEVDGNKTIGWGNKKIGLLRPLGTLDGNFESHVKMHLVNSFLDPGANGWAGNWVFGAHDLNAKHSQIESAAKLLHPKYGVNKALDYRTTVTGKDGTTTDEDTLAQEILDGLDALKPLGFNAPTLEKVKEEASIDDETLANYANLWNAAVSNNAVANKIEVEYQPYTYDGDNLVVQGALTTTEAETDVASARRVNITASTFKLSAWGIFDLAPEPPPKRRRTGIATMVRTTGDT